MFPVGCRPSASSRHCRLCFTPLLFSLTSEIDVQATCLIETLPAAFEMDEILFELREHSAGLNCGRWDYIFSFIKTLKQDPQARHS